MRSGTPISRFSRKSARRRAAWSIIEHNDYTYQLADQNGIVLWSEIPLVNSITETPAFYNNAMQQLRELIRQNYNHPSVVCWGMFNEMTIGSSTDARRSTRPTRRAGRSDAPVHRRRAGQQQRRRQRLDSASRRASTNITAGMSSPLNGIASWADTIHARYPHELHRRQRIRRGREHLSAQRKPGRVADDHQLLSS